MLLGGGVRLDEGHTQQKMRLVVGKKMRKRKFDEELRTARALGMPLWPNPFVQIGCCVKSSAVW
jgi:hypothetical protein